jgi:hypothetical protein
VKDSGEVSKFLSIYIRKGDSGELILEQEEYIDWLLGEFNMGNCKGLNSPLEVGCINIDRDTERKFCQSIYRRAVGCLLYLSSTTRPDIANSVYIVNQYCKDPTVTDRNNIKHILRYLKKPKFTDYTFAGQTGDCRIYRFRLGYQ